jgi:hypothetical protein
MVDLENVKEGNSLLSLVKRPRPMSFLVVYEGKVTGKSKQKPTPSSVYSLCARLLKKTHKISLDKIVKEEQKILNELDKLNGSLEIIKDTRLRKGDKISKRENKSLQEEEEEIQKKIAELKEREAKLLTLPEPEKEKVAKS